ncbi:MAG: flagellar hook-length control protein FliK [Gammaproteobacteria bacterium]|nr:flagellar hook-length control protein FliK [Gammaproteobacteria bacterium]MBU2058413.1 flagellar hook-length control protein FliK [Gammaproteobacteria bacterium]MBU2176534.1 flagellar hook-length control protein FliK [Gammaproteobacteria bacterium]MBU2248524.1 flagellar hook-length control protein FliK [Gammaproteobacteria bacterium]MBU2345613.1 flagellar hook-length control protein FliK [Gammaproteobacteria bacterium]
MAELLSMTLLSSEPVSAAKPQAALSQDASNDGSAEPDQSFAATLAAEVNGKTPEKSAKASAKTRQNTASLVSEQNKSSENQSAGTADTKSEAAGSAVTNSPSDTKEDKTLTDTDAEPLSAEKGEAGQSHWLNLLEKAKSLHERLTKAEKAEADTRLTPGPRVDKPGPGMTEEPAELQTEVVKGSSDNITEARVLATTATAAAKTTGAAQHDGAIVLNEKPLTEQNTAKNTAQNTEQKADQQHNAEELKALKLVAQTESKTTAKNDTADTTAKNGTVDTTAKPTDNALKQAAAVADKTLTTTDKDTGQDQSKIIAHIEKSAPKVQQAAAVVLSEHLAERPEASTEAPEGADKPLTEAKEVTDKLLTKTNKDAGPDQSKIFAPIEKALKSPVSAVKAEPEPAVVPTAEPVPPVTVNKALLQTEQPALPKSVVLTSGHTAAEQDSDAETETLPAAAPASDVKVSVQAQSAAAIVAPVTPQTKTVNAEAKVTTEEALKQLQAATVSAQAEQGTSSSSGGSEQQNKAETLLSVIEQQKVTAPLVTETSSFSNQLKSSLEKTNAAMTVTAREAVTEQSQKQADPLGQKLNLIQPEASNQLKEKMLMMVKDKVHTAEIRLDPSELGSMQIKISLQQDQMSVQFMVQQGNAKELMEQQMPKLRELLQQQGIELSQGSVQQQNQSSSGQEGGRRTAGGNGTAANGADELVDPVPVPTRHSDRVVDYYA